MNIQSSIRYGIIVTALALTILGAAEYILRLATPSLSNPIATEISFENSPWYQVNRGYLKRYFPAGTPLIPELKPTLLRKQKLPKSIRIMCLGESSMFGTPYQMTCTIPAMLRKQLRHRYPGREIEVINFGASAINSNVILDLSKRVVEFEPDLILLYLGHNEFYGPDGVGAPLLQRHFPGTIPYIYALRDFRLVSLIQGLLRGQGEEMRALAENNLMKQVSKGSMVQLHSTDAERVFTLFEDNLLAMLGVFRSKGIPVIMSDVTSNLDFPPFDHDSAAAQSFEAQFNSHDIGNLSSRLGGILQHDSTNALAHYWLGKTLLARGDSEEARVQLISAKDDDLLKFRAPERTNFIIRDVCRMTGTPLVSSDSLFAAQLRSGISADDLYWEHLHPTPRGYYLIADLFFRKILDLGLIHDDSLQESRESSLPFEMDTLSVCWLELAYGDISIQHLTGKWPFVGYKRHPLVFNNVEEELRRIAQDTYDRKLLWDEGCYKSAEYFWKHGNLRPAQTTYEAIVEENPENYYAQYLLANLLLKRGDPISARRHYLNALRSNPGYPNAHLDLGLLEINAGQFDEAIQQLTSVIALIKGDEMRGMKATAYYGLAAAYANKGDYDTALQHVEESLRIIPTYADAISLKGGILTQRKNKK